MNHSVVYFSKVVSFTVGIDEKVRLLREDPDDPEKETVPQVEPRLEKAEKLKLMWKDINKWSRSIEVIYQSEEQEPLLTRVYFPFDPEVGLSCCHCHK